MAAAGSRLRALLVLLATILFASAAHGDDIERITNFTSDVTVQPNGVLRVRETITVNAQGDNIVHGIKRDVPTLGVDGEHHSFDVLSVTRDGNPEPYSVSSIDGGTEIRIGDADITLSHGEHTYRIAYQTDRQIRFFPKFDEIYWNVTGNDWRFEIVRAEAVIHLPRGATVRQSAFYTGAPGARDQDARLVSADGQTIRFETTAPLYVRQGLTVAVGFSKGAVTPPDAWDRVTYFARDHAPESAVLIGSLLLLLYFFVAWLLVGRDPHPPVVIPQYTAPKGLSAAAVRYLVRRAFDNKAFAATLVSLAVKHAVTIKQNADTDFVVKRTDAGADVLPIEMRVLKTLFVRQQSVALTRANHSVIALATGELSMTLDTLYRDYWSTNHRWFVPGLVGVALILLSVIFLSDAPGETTAVMAWSTMTGFATLVFALLDAAMWRTMFGSHSGRVSGFIFSVVLLVPVLAFGAMTASVLFFTFEQVHAFAILLLAIPVAIAVLFWRLLPRPSDAAAAALADIAGLKMFLAAAVTDELKLTGAPDITPEVFERFLPYAIALDCENAWAKRFEAKSAQSYQPEWYASNTNVLVPALTASVGTALATATSASTPTSSFSSSGSSSFSSGSSGGGFSGGGGGGGGGSGW